MSRLQVKNRAPAPIQITAEQLLRESKERGLEESRKPAKQFITDVEELKLYQQTKRKDFEDQLRRQRHKIGLWCKYGLWEASQKEFERARSVFERALDVDYKNTTLWMKYSEMEMKNGFIAHARNIYDRVVTLLPRVDIFWLKYTYMEEFIGAIVEARQVFERWMKWEPSDPAWYAYIKFEIRLGNIIAARGIYERYVALLPTSRAYIKYAKWEEKLGELTNARSVFERSLVEVHPMERTIELLQNFASFEERCKEFERARVIYQYALESAMNASEHEKKNEEIEEIKQNILNFEKKYGSRESVDEAILARRRTHYESLVTSDGYNYDAWFDYIRLEEAENDNLEKIREIYERAVSFAPPIAEKRYWRRYIYLWINYALFEELQAKETDRARAVYAACLRVIPHKSFTFGKIWILAAQLEVRERDLSAARKILGKGIGLTGKENVFKGYIDLELQLGEMDRCRAIYAKYIETMPYNCGAWKNFAQLEVNLGETARARGVYELAINQSELDMPELLWKAYIDFEINEGEYGRVRELYERLLDKTTHVKVWLSYAQFEASLSGGGDRGEIDRESLLASRRVFERGYAALKSQKLKEERLLLLESWREVESRGATVDNHLQEVEAKFPRKIKMRRPVAEGSEDVEEFYEYQFPDDETKIVGLKLLENAMKWKQAAAAAATKPASDERGEEDEASGDLGGVFGSNSFVKRKHVDGDEGTEELLCSAKKKQATDDNEIDIDV